MSKQENHFIISGQILYHSGYSRWGEIFTARGAKITTIGKPDATVLSKINIYIIVDPDTTSENPAPNYISAEDIGVYTKMG